MATVAADAGIMYGLDGVAELLFRSCCNPHLRAGLLLVCGLVHEAVEVYIHSSLAPFALLLSRLRLPADHPLQHESLDAWLAEAKEEEEQQQQRIGRLLRVALALEFIREGRCCNMKQVE